jgi:CheY-like chemotaxis protein
MISPRTRPLSDIPLAASMPVVPNPVVQESSVLRLEVIPAADVVPAPDVVPTPDAASGVSQPPTVLLVDEDAAMRKLLAMLLHREGYTVRHAADAREATADLSANGVDLVVANLSDDKQPVVIQKWLSTYPELSIIALSSGTEAKVALNEAAADNLLTLPLPSRPRDVVQAVRALLDRSRTRALHLEPARIEPSRATQCAPPSFAHTPRTGTGWPP